jgi:hypothetical protein
MARARARVVCGRGRAGGRAGGRTGIAAGMVFANTPSKLMSKLTARSPAGPAVLSWRVGLLDGRGAWFAMT